MPLIFDIRVCPDSARVPPQVSTIRCWLRRVFSSNPFISGENVSNALTCTPALFSLPFSTDSLDRVQVSTIPCQWLFHRCDLPIRPGQDMIPVSSQRALPRFRSIDSTPESIQMNERCRAPQPDARLYTGACDPKGVKFLFIEYSVATAEVAVVGIPGMNVAYCPALNST